MTTLFCVDNNDECSQFLLLVKSLRADMEIDIRPKFIVKQNFPESIEEIVPSLMVENTIYCGLEEIITYYETVLGLHDLFTIVAESF